MSLFFDLHCDQLICRYILRHLAWCFGSWCFLRVYLWQWRIVNNFGACYCTIYKCDQAPHQNENNNNELDVVENRLVTWRNCLGLTYINIYVYIGKWKVFICFEEFIFLPCDDVLCRRRQRRHGPAYPWSCIHIPRQYSLHAKKEEDATPGSAALSHSPSLSLTVVHPLALHTLFRSCTHACSPLLFSSLFCFAFASNCNCGKWKINFFPLWPATKCDSLALDDLRNFHVTPPPSFPSTWPVDNYRAHTLISLVIELNRSFPCAIISVFSVVLLLICGPTLAYKHTLAGSMAHTLSHTHARTHGRSA